MIFLDNYLLKYYTYQTVKMQSLMYANTLSAQSNSELSNLSRSSRLNRRDNNSFVIYNDFVNARFVTVRTARQRARRQALRDITSDNTENTDPETGLILPVLNEVDRLNRDETRVPLGTIDMNIMRT